MPPMLQDIISRGLDASTPLPEGTLRGVRETKKEIGEGDIPFDEHPAADLRPPSPLCRFLHGIARFQLRMFPGFLRCKDGRSASVPIDEEKPTFSSYAGSISRS
ncbi:hypothetical protein RIF29_48580 [Crotalaria pallida]|uniref:Uncharacterized protein n=1 Tax=Crotalaria pallida TaxID=3830 RepID=A0AAN9DNE0_CROPI